MLLSIHSPSLCILFSSFDHFHAFRSLRNVLASVRDAANPMHYIFIGREISSRPQCLCPAASRFPESGIAGRKDGRDGNPSAASTIWTRQEEKHLRSHVSPFCVLVKDPLLVYSAAVFTPRSPSLSLCSPSHSNCQANDSPLFSPSLFSPTCRSCQLREHSHAPQVVPDGDGAVAAAVPIAAGRRRCFVAHRRRGQEEDVVTTAGLLS